MPIATTVGLAGEPLGVPRVPAVAQEVEQALADWNRRPTSWTGGWNRVAAAPQISPSVGPEVGAAGLLELAAVAGVSWSQATVLLVIATSRRQRSRGSSNGLIQYQLTRWATWPACDDGAGRSFTRANLEMGWTFWPARRRTRVTLPDDQ